MQKRLGPCQTGTTHAFLGRRTLLALTFRDSAMPTRDLGTRTRVREALLFSGYTSGFTHHFYHYPARFSPQFAKTVIEELSEPGDWVLDPFMGGGTSIIEGLALGRRMVGVDINALAHFVATVRTSPLSQTDEAQLLGWAADISRTLATADPSREEAPSVLNLPRPVEAVLAGALVSALELPFPRQRAFARCALLRLAQWALEARKSSVIRRHSLARELPRLVQSMLSGLGRFVEQCRTVSVPKDQITSHRLLLNRSTIGLGEEGALATLRGRIKLVLTSPPYPAVHVLYHRWQVRGRRETPAPYWIANVADGCGASFYTFGSRTPTGLDNYFRSLSAAFASVRPFLASDAPVVQLIAFTDAAAQLPRYLDAMRTAGYAEVCPFGGASRTLSRYVPNRRWFAKLQGNTSAACELLLVHRPRR